MGQLVDSFPGKDRKCVTRPAYFGALIGARLPLVICVRFVSALYICPYLTLGPHSVLNSGLRLPVEKRAPSL